MPTLAQRFWSRVEPQDEGCWKWSGSIAPNGYARMKWKGKAFYGHRLMNAFTKGPIADNLEVMHSCDNRWCINPAHLDADTAGANIRDAARKNRMNHKLSVSEVLEIRSLVSGGLTQKEVACKFKILACHVSRIMSGQARKYV